MRTAFVSRYDEATGISIYGIYRSSAKNCLGTNMCIHPTNYGIFIGEISEYNNEEKHRIYTENANTGRYTDNVFMSDADITRETQRMNELCVDFRPLLRDQVFYRIPRTIAVMWYKTTMTTPDMCMNCLYLHAYIKDCYIVDIMEYIMVRLYFHLIGDEYSYFTV
jgi:hypothetical protein